MSLMDEFPTAPHPPPLVPADHLCIAMEYAPGGEVFTQLARRGRFTEGLAREYFQQLIMGLRYSHTLSICHR